MKTTALICAGASLMAGAAVALPVKHHTGMNDTDRNFMMTLAKAGVAEIQAGQIAAQRGDRFDQQYGRQMVKMHQSTGTQLQRLATKRSITLPSAPAPEDSAAIHRLEKMQPKQFDAAYHHFAVMSHRQAISLFRDEIANGRDPGVKAWAQKTLPMIKMHFKEARSMQMN